MSYVAGKRTKTSGGNTMTRTVGLIAILLILFVSLESKAFVITFDEGKWPVSWPKELETWRKRAQTIDLATGMQEHMYLLHFKNRDEFEKLWPVLTTLRTPGSPLTLSKVGTVAKGWEGLFSNTKPCVRIRAPNGSYLGGKVANGDQVDLKELEARSMLFAGAPWPEELIGPKGELPEYVTDIQLAGGKRHWKPIDPRVDKALGFLHRARVDLELVIDGEIIDLNRIALPKDAQIIDLRFPETARK